MGLCVHPPTKQERTNKAGGSHITANGMGESTTYFCAAAETARDITTKYTDMQVGTLPKHKFEETCCGRR